MALKATKLIRAGQELDHTADLLRLHDPEKAQRHRYEAVALYISARDWAERHHQPRLAATARRLLAEHYVRKARALR